MSTDLMLPEGQLPAHLQKAQTNKDEFAGGVADSFGILAFRGKVWRYRKGGEEQVFQNEDGDAVQSLPMVFVRANPRLSKTYYEGKFKEGSNEKPTCWSADGIKPDQGVPNRQSPLCASCPKNEWGSKVGDEGQKQKACDDVRRMAIITDLELQAVVNGQKSIDEAELALLRVPAATLKPLKQYAVDILKPKGLEPYMVVTRVSFDNDVAYPRFVFKGIRLLNEAEFRAVEELRDSDTVKRILDVSAEHADGGTTDKGDDASGSVSTAKEEAPESAPPETSKKKKSAAAVEEESYDAEVEDEDEWEDEDEEEAPPPPPKKKKRKKKVAKKTATKPPAPAEEEAPSSPSDEADVDALLDGLLD